MRFWFSGPQFESGWDHFFERKEGRKGIKRTTTAGFEPTPPEEK